MQNSVLVPMVVEQTSRGERAFDIYSRRVDVQRDILLRVLGGQKQDLRDDYVRDVVVDGRTQENDIFLK